MVWPVTSETVQLSIKYSSLYVDVFSFYHSSLFVLGSVLAWAVTGRWLGGGRLVRTVLALGEFNTIHYVSMQFQFFIYQNDGPCGFDF